MKNRLVLFALGFLLILIFGSTASAISGSWSMYPQPGQKNQTPSPPQAEPQKEPETSGSDTDSQKPRFLFYDPEWMFVSPLDRTQARPVALIPDRTRVAVLFAYSIKPDAVIGAVKDFSHVAGREFVRSVPLPSGGSVDDWQVLLLDRRLNDNEYFQLLDAIRIQTDHSVRAVSPIVSYRGESYLLLPRANVRFKPWHDLDHEEFVAFLKKQYPMLDLARKRDDKEGYYTVEPSSVLAMPFFKALDLLVKDIRVLSVMPEFVPLAPPITAAAYAAPCGKVRGAGIFTVTIGTPFCYHVSIAYNPELVRFLTEDSVFKNVASLPFHTPGSSANPSVAVLDADFKRNRISPKEEQIRSVYRMVYYDVGDYALTGFAGLLYQQATLASYGDQNLNLFFPVVPLKVISQTSSAMDDFEAIDSPPVPAPVRVVPKSTIVSPPAVEPVTPREVQWTEKVTRHAVAGWRWVFALPFWTKVYGALAILSGVFGILLAGIAVFRRFGAEGESVISRAGDLFLMAYGSVAGEIEYQKARRELRRVAANLVSFSRGESQLVVRKVLKRFFEDVFPDFERMKGMSRLEVVKAIRVLEERQYTAFYGKETVAEYLGNPHAVHRLVEELLNSDVPQESFSASANLLLAALSERRSVLRRSVKSWFRFALVRPGSI